MNRRAGRELALQMLFASAFWGDDAGSAGKNVIKTSKAEGEICQFATQLFEGTIKEMERIDELISSRLNNWRLNRLHLVDRSIIRLAVFEILYMDETPISVAVDQAVRLGKKFGGDESGRFINGILGGIIREMEKTDEEKDND